MRKHVDALSVDLKSALPAQTADEGAAASIKPNRFLGAGQMGGGSVFPRSWETPKGNIGWCWVSVIT